MQEIVSPSHKGVYENSKGIHGTLMTKLIAPQALSPTGKWIPKEM